MKPEARFTRAVVKYARAQGWRVLHIRPGRTKEGWRTPVLGDGAGFPDTLMLRDQRQVVAELKCGKNKVTPKQREWLQAFERAGVPAYWWYPTDWDEIEQVLSR